MENFRCFGFHTGVMTLCRPGVGWGQRCCDFLKEEVKEERRSLDKEYTDRQNDAVNSHRCKMGDDDFFFSFYIVCLVFPAARTCRPCLQECGPRS